MKLYKLSSMIVAAVVVVAAAPLFMAGPAHAGLMAEYQFEGNGNAAVGADGSLVGTPEFTATTGGRFGKAIKMSGDDYMTLAAIGNNYSQVSISTWVNGYSFGDGIYHGDGWATGSLHYVFWNRPVVGVKGNNPIDTIATNSPGTSGWHLITFSYDSGTKAINYYLDAADNGITSYSSAGTINLTSAAVGAWVDTRDIGNPASRYLHGSLDDLAIWDTALTPGKAKALYNATEVFGLSSYDANKMNTLFNVYDSGTSTTIGSLTWTKDTTSIDFHGKHAGDAWYDTGNGKYYVALTDIAGVATVVPEPSVFVLLSIGAISLLAYAWRRRRAA